MKVLVTRIHKGMVSADGETVGSINRGIAVFVGIKKGDSPDVLAPMSEKVINLRIFEDEKGKMHYSVKDKNYQILCISNFTLCANTDKGRRPSFENSMPPQQANKLFEDFVMVLKNYGIDVQTGEFGKHMEIDLEMDGPVNIILET